MSNIDRYKTFESKKNWLKITQDKLSDFKKMIAENPSVRDLDLSVFPDLNQLHKDVVSDWGGEAWFEEWIKFTCDGDYISTQLTRDGEIRKDFSSSLDRIQNPYRTYDKITKWLDKKRVSGKKIEAYYIVDFETSFDDIKKHGISKKLESLKAEFENTEEFMKSLGFEVQRDTYMIRGTIKLENFSEGLFKTIDVSDLVSKDKVLDFESFLLKKNLTRKDAEEIAKIFTK
jgi:hypothetical protein